MTAEIRFWHIVMIRVEMTSLKYSTKNQSIDKCEFLNTIKNTQRKSSQTKFHMINTT